MIIIDIFSVNSFGQYLRFNMLVILVSDSFLCGMLSILINVIDMLNIFYRYHWVIVLLSSIFVRVFVFWNCICIEFLPLFFGFFLMFIGNYWFKFTWWIYHSISDQVIHRVLLIVLEKSSVLVFFFRKINIIYTKTKLSVLHAAFYGICAYFLYFDNLCCSCLHNSS